MTVTLKNSWKLFAASATRSKARCIRNLLYSIVTNIKLRFFFLFSLGLSLVYVVVDVLTSPTLQSLGYSLFVDRPPREVLRLIQENALMNFGESGVATKISIFFFIALCAYVLTVIAMRPVDLFNLRRRYFTSNIAHELNTPLSILKATAEVARMGGNEMSQAERTEFTLSVIEEVDRMAEIVKYFLHFGTPEQRVQLQMSAVNISSVINKVTRTLSWLATKCGVTIEAPKEEGGVVWGNFTALEEMLSGLVKNAIMHSPRGAIVHITLKSIVGQVELSVLNSGEKISATDLPYIFDPFYKGERTVHCGRLGLGLTIAREIAKMHLTDIDAHSDSHVGTEFKVKLPK